MNAAQFLIALFHAWGGSIHGRTLLQKRAFFVQRLSGVDPGLAYDAHYYGPYSSTVDSTIEQLKNLGFVREETNEFGVMSGGFEMRRYDYRLTQQGQQVAERLSGMPEFQLVEESVRRIEQAGNRDYIELSIAAKAFFILLRQKRPMSVADITKEAEKFNWNIGEQSVNKAVGFLKSVGLTTDAAAAPTQ
jgi:uncharacterized protein YwgA